jgi:exosortase
MDEQTKRRMIFLGVVTAVLGGLTAFPLLALLGDKSRGMFYEYYSHIFLIPLVSGYLLYLDRTVIWSSVKASFSLGTMVTAAGLIGYGTGLLQGQSLPLIDRAAWEIASLLIAWLGAFIIIFGTKAFQTALFPLLFMFFVVPIPMDLMEGFIYLLQVGSAWSTALIFSILGTSYFQEGFIFQMGKVTIEIAKECSGIRSTMAMVITGVLAAHLFLRDPGKKLFLMLTILPITVFKNGIRIVILTLLAIHVDERFLTGGFLHKSGGFLFYIPGLIIFGAILLWLRRMEKKKGPGSEERG